MYKQKLTSLVLICLLLSPVASLAQSSVYTAPKEDIDKIKDEGINRSQVMQTLSYMSDVIGPRLTAWRVGYAGYGSAFTLLAVILLLAALLLGLMFRA